jgi:putative NADH-flavin reductase
MAPPSKHRIAVLGATGATGRLFIERALQDGHEVTALARTPDRLAIRHSSLRVVAGDVLSDGPELAEVVDGTDVVVSALGRGLELRSHGLMAHGVPRILAAMERHGVTRLVLLSAYGVGRVDQDVPLIPRLMFRTILRDIYADKETAEEIVRKSNLRWTIVAPVHLNDRPEAGRYRAGEDVRTRGFAQISRADVARFMLRCVDDPATFRKRVVIDSATDAPSGDVSRA